MTATAHNCPSDHRTTPIPSNFSVYSAMLAMRKIRFQSPFIPFLTSFAFAFAQPPGKPKAAELIRNFVPKEVFTVFTEDELKEHQMTDNEAAALYDFYNGTPMEPRKVRPAPSHVISCHEAQLRTPSRPCDDFCVHSSLPSRIYPHVVK